MSSSFLSLEILAALNIAPTEPSTEATDTICAREACVL